MSERQDFERLSGWIGRIKTSVDLAAADKAATETLLDSAEYELAQLRRHVDVVLSSDTSNDVPEAPGCTPDGVFNIKLRNPDRVGNAEWWAVLGLNQ